MSNNSGKRPRKYTPLHKAACIGHTEVVLLDRGAEPNMADQYGCTPIYKAAGWGRKEVVQLLLTGGADPE